MLSAMDDVAIGRLMRSIRIRLGRRQVEVAEAALTGESVPVSKATAPVADTALLADRCDV